METHLNVERTQKCVGFALLILSLTGCFSPMIREAVPGQTFLVESSNNEQKLFSATWVSGTDTRYQGGAYGTLNVGSTSNIPSERHEGITWTDAEGNLWLFGGFDTYTVAANGYALNQYYALNDLWEYTPDTREWTWKGGCSNPQNASCTNPSFGTKGVSSPSNFPGSRSGAFSWIDASDNMYFFGGESSTTYYNDIWQYNPGTQEWTWVGGGNVGNQKGTYGTQGVPSTSNIAGARQPAFTWMDSSGNLWTFGGSGFASTTTAGYLNDLWEYNPGSQEWTWVAGSNLINQNGIYGTKGIGSTSNMPGARRYFVAGAVDSSGDVWFFGGQGYDRVGTYGYLNDLWKFSPSTLEWTWVAGSDLANQSGTYGIQGAGSTSNIPGGRTGPASWTDSSGNIWLFGGGGYDSVGASGYLNDLWKFSPSTLEWTWVGGSNLVNPSGTFGIEGISASSNIPSARAYVSLWKDSSDRIWLFGGSGYDANDLSGNLNDLWTLTITP